jgi:tetratricopeptide (TPR) repeat protein
VLEQARGKLREAAEAAARAARVRQHVQRARELLEQQKFGRAIEEAERAIALDAADGVAAALIEEARARDAQVRAEGERQTALRKRTKAAEPLLAAARLALRNRDFQVARSFADSALNIDLESAEARSLSAQALAALAEQDPHGDAGGCEVSADDDTARLRTGWRGTSRVPAAVGVWASRLRRTLEPNRLSAWLQTARRAIDTARSAFGHILGRRP